MTTKSTEIREMIEVLRERYRQPDTIELLPILDALNHRMDEIEEDQKRLAWGVDLRTFMAAQGIQPD